MDQPLPLIRSLPLADLGPLLAESGLPAYRSRQLAQWLFKHGSLDWEQMSNLPAAMRQDLAGQFDLVGLELQERLVSADGTRKFLFSLRDGSTIESVIIPMTDHATFCVSTQVGCAMACRFCATARGGLVRNLETGEILEQILRLAANLTTEPMDGLGDRQFNVVFMGMGEPLDNWDAVETALGTMMHEEGLAMSRRRIQISTSGPGEGLRRLIAAAPGVGLTLSLGGSTDDERRRVMPVPGRTSVTEAVALTARYAAAAGRRATVAWVLIAGSTDGLDQASRLAALVRGKPMKVNLIPLNLLDGDSQQASPATTILAFQRVLTEAGVDAFIRASGGQDIAAACGQLRRRRQGAG